MNNYTHYSEGPPPDTRKFSLSANGSQLKPTNLMVSLLGGLAGELGDINSTYEKHTEDTNLNLQQIRAREQARQEALKLRQEQIEKQKKLRIQQLAQHYQDNKEFYKTQQTQQNVPVQQENIIPQNNILATSNNMEYIPPNNYEESTAFLTKPLLTNNQTINEREILASLEQISNEMIKNNHLLSHLINVINDISLNIITFTEKNYNKENELTKTNSVKEVKPKKFKVSTEVVAVKNEKN